MRSTGVATVAFADAPGVTVVREGLGEVLGWVRTEVPNGVAFGTVELTGLCRAAVCTGVRPAGFDETFELTPGEVPWFPRLTSVIRGDMVSSWRGVLTSCRGVGISERGVCGFEETSPL